MGTLWEPHCPIRPISQTWGCGLRQELGCIGSGEMPGWKCLGSEATWDLWPALFQLDFCRWTLPRAWAGGGLVGGWQVQGYPSRGSQ